MIACGTRNDTVNILDSKTLNVIEKFDFEDEITNCKMHQVENWTLLIAGNNLDSKHIEDGVIKLYDLRKSSKHVCKEFVQSKITALDSINKDNILVMGKSIQVSKNF